MGQWAAGLYSGDTAMDLRSDVSAMARLPLEPDEIVALLAEANPAAADPADPDHTVFWLVVADQLSRRGAISPVAMERAQAILRDGSDLARFAELGAKDADLRRRKANLDKLAAALAVARPKPRKTLSAPQPHAVEVGDVISFPTSQGHPINPYFKSKDDMTPVLRPGQKSLGRGWHPDGFAAAVVVQTGHHLGYLAWCRMAVTVLAQAKAPTLETLPGLGVWRIAGPGTLSPAHARKMEIEVLGRVRVRAEEVERLWSAARGRSIRSAATSDISIVNDLHVLTPEEKRPPGREALEVGPLSAFAELPNPRRSGPSGRHPLGWLRR